MSKLYIRVKTGFYNHRKTMRLRAALGDDAFWVVPRLWAYAAEHQPDGNIAGYSTEELAHLLGCSKHATSILDALKASGYVDADGMIHDWDEHNGYHQRYSVRAKKAAAAMHEKRRASLLNNTGSNIGKDNGDKQCLEHACSIYECYPRKKARPVALRAIQKALKSVPFETLLEKTKEFAELVEAKEPQYIPYPATWFNAEGWNDNEQVKLEKSLFQPKQGYTPNLG